MRIKLLTMLLRVTSPLPTDVREMNTHLRSFRSNRNLRTE